MPLYLEGSLKLVSVNNVKGRDATQDFTYYTNYLQYTDRQGLEKVFEANSKEDFRPIVGKNGVFTITAYKQKAVTTYDGKERETTLYRLSISAFDEAPRSGRDKDNG